ncbi:hypothetical protein GQX73_g8932 [Xylaria multiplex]|uniref:NACHT domain-containing protein n=1 Tax=Xylaria multiplex TaxID=323545 RepID=A0A7C8IIT0_9PEZI|nr:hypothetical protein GQX73_g8932 [Xylaria multiplex]
MTSTGGANTPGPSLMIDWLTRSEGRKTRRKFWTRTRDRENNPTSPPTSPISRSNELTLVDTPSALVKPTPELSSQTLVGDSPVQEATEPPPPPPDTKTPATQTEPELAPTNEIMAVGGAEKEGPDKSKPVDDVASARDGALFLLWDGAYDALLNDDVPELSRFDSHFLWYWRRKGRLSAIRNTSDRGGFEPTNPVARRDKMRQILEALLAEPDPAGNKGTGNSETKLTGLSEFNNIAREAALRESQRGGAVAWVAICAAASVLIRMSTPTSLAFRQHLVNIMSAMEWYCSLPALLLEQPDARIQETRMAILDLYKAILLYLVRLASQSIEQDVGFLLESEEDLKFPDTIITKERAVMACFDRSYFQSKLDQLVKSLAFSDKQTDTENKDPAEEAPVSNTVPKPSERWSYSFRDELPKAPEDRQGVQDHAYSWVKSTKVYTDFLRSDAPDSDRELWITGKPGTGKSMLLEAIVQDMSWRQEFDPELETKPVVTYIAAFFCNRGKERAENAAAIVRCLVSQVLNQQTQLRQHFFGACDMARRGQFDRPEDLHVIFEVFRAILSDGAFKPTCFVIDAIDECCSDGDEAEINRAVRPRQRHKEITPLELSLDGDSASPSTEPVLSSAAAEHIKFRVAELMRGVNVADSFRKDVEDKMLKQSKGNFLWVDLVCKQILSHGLPWNAIYFVDSERLPNKALPSGLEPLYAHMEAALDELQWDSPYYCREIINTLAVAYEPLRLCELGEFLPRDAIRPSIDLAIIIAKQCFAFLEICDGRVFFVHQSAKNFFRKKMEDKAQRHSYMTLCCLRALEQQLRKPFRCLP